MNIRGIKNYRISSIEVNCSFKKELLQIQIILTPFLRAVIIGRIRQEQFSEDASQKPFQVIMIYQNDYHFFQPLLSKSSQNNAPVEKKATEQNS